jgi:hypothetical protein
MLRVPSSNMQRTALSVARRQSTGRAPPLKLQPRKNLSSTKDKAAAEAEEARQKVLQDANEKMKTYHDARLQKLRGELPSRNKTGPESNRFQVGIVVSFMLAFAATPFLGKKIAQDKEFREKYIPSWYDFTIKRPTSELSREEVHEQILQLQKEIRARAIAGEFSDEKIHKMRRYMDGLDPDKKFDPANDEHAWSKLHPGVADDEDVEDD